MNLDQDDKGNAQCAVHIAVTDEQSAQNSLPRPQLVSPPTMRLLRVPLQYPRKASTLEPRGTKMARAPTLPERMEDTSHGSPAREM